MSIFVVMADESRHEFFIEKMSDERLNCIMKEQFNGLAGWKGLVHPHSWFALYQEATSRANSVAEEKQWWYNELRDKV